MASSPKKPNPIDIYVGSRVRLRRSMQGLSQEKLGDALGITFQQVQKYEKGTNRIGASRLQEISEILTVPISYFFENLPGNQSNTEVAGLTEGDSSKYEIDLMTSNESLKLQRAFMKIKDPQVRKKIIDLVKSLSEVDGK